MLQNNTLPQTSQDDFNPVDIDFDPETGEVIDNLDVLTVDLPRLARAIIQNNERYTKAIDNTKREIERLKAWVKTYEERRDNGQQYLLDKAKSIIEVTGEESVEYAGLGKFRYQKAVDKVDTSIYDMLPDTERAELFTGYKGLFREKYSITPDLNEIKKAFKNGGDVPDCFTIEQGGRNFIFKEEK